MSVSFETLALAKKLAGGGGGSSITVDSALSSMSTNPVQNKVITEAISPFVVTLTPINSDYSGEMDKTAAEITAAYNAGRQIVFNVDVSTLGFTEWKTLATIDSKYVNSNGRVAAQAFLVDVTVMPDKLIWICTDDDADSANTYSTKVYPLGGAVVDIDIQTAILTLDDNTEYYLTGISDLTLTYPSSRFECFIDLQTASSGTVTVTFPSGTEFIGDVPTFGNDEHWQLSIKNGVVVAGKAVTPA